ncbi:MAG: DUF2332 family protein, partial [Sphingopyxis sp.]
TWGWFLICMVWIFVPAALPWRATPALGDAGAAAPPDRPLAWIALEANRTSHNHELVVRYWPGGEAGHTLARAHPHGAWVEWIG